MASGDFHRVPGSSGSGVMISLGLFRQVSNSPELRRLLLQQGSQAGELPQPLALVKAKLVISPVQVAVATRKALQNKESGKMVTRSLGTEIIYNVATGSKNISESLAKFGIGDDDSELLAVLVADSEDALAVAEKILVAKVTGRLVNVEELKDVTDRQALIKANKLKFVPNSGECSALAMAKEAGGDILQDWLKDSPATDLLETDIAEGSFNKRPWCHSVVACDNYEVCSANEKKLVLKDVNQQLSNLKISDTSKLASVSRRTLCSKCKKSRLYFCYTCHIPLDATLDLIPVVQNLPLKVDIIKDVRELDGKSSATHAKIICPADVQIFAQDEIPKYDGENVVVVYPGRDSRPLKEFVRSFHQWPLQRVVFVDATWKQSKRIMRDYRLSNLPHVLVENRDTLFWRHQKVSDQHLATVEAIYYFLVDYHREVLNLEYQNEYDNLLFLFKFMLENIRAVHISNESL